MPLIVVGSANMDLVVRTNRFPSPGETVMGSDFRTFAGGKGGNQAVAAAKLGADVHLVGCVGRDSFGVQLRRSLGDAGVKTEFLCDGDKPTGIAAITLDENGQNLIVVAPGANAECGADLVHQACDQIKPDVILVQLEIPLEAVEKAFACTTGVKILNPAPATQLPDSLLEDLDWITPNELETEALTGVYACDLSMATKAAHILRSRGVRNVLITLGGDGCLLLDEQGTQHSPGYAVDVVDTTGAGDAFSGAFAAALSMGSSAQEAVGLAIAASALCVSRMGAQASMPTASEVHEFIATRSAN